MRTMDSQDDNCFVADPTLLTDAILKILNIEERIEEKLDAVLARGSFRESTTSLEKVNVQGRQLVSESEVAAFRRGHSSEGIEDRQCSGVVDRYSLSDGDGRRSSTFGAGVRVRSEFQLLIESALEDDDSHIKGMLTVWRSENQSQDNGAFGAGRFSDYIPINPNSGFSVGWSLINVFVLMSELTAVPYVLAWEVDLGVIPTCTAAFWSFDAFISFITGTYNAEGEKNPIRVSARAYALSWFPLDSSIVLLDWLSVFDIGGGPGVKLLRFSKLARMLRILAILRFSKLNRNFNRVVDASANGNVLRMVFRVVYLSLCIILFLHFVACFWFFLGHNGPTDTGKRWLDVQIPMTDGTMIDLSAGERYYQYLICFHWSVGAFTLGNMEVGYTNSFERLFGVVFIVSSLLFGSVLISVLSAVLVDHQTELMETTVKLRIVDRFLRENEVGDLLALRVQKVCFERAKVKEKLTFGETIALNNLPAWLYKELRYEIIGRFLKQHDLFNCWSTLSVSVVKDYSVDGVDMVFLKPGDELFKAHADSEDTYFLSSGKLTYSKEEHDNSNAVVVPARTWLSEASLWSSWRHVGTCEAQDPCTIAVANYKSLAQHAEGHRLIRAITSSYCQCFCRGLALARPPTSQFPDDMCVPLTKFAEMLMHFPNDLRTIISTHAIHVSKLEKKCAAELEKEVCAGKCDAYINIEGELMRIVHVMALMLQDAEGRVLYRIGEVVSRAIAAEDSEEPARLHVIPEVKLPGLKQDRAEFLADALNRLVNQKMTILRGTFEHVNTVFEEDVAFSTGLGVKTWYLRAKMVCFLQADFPAKLVSRDNLADPNAELVRSVSDSGVNLNFALPLRRTPLYVIIEGKKPFIYAWLPPDIVDTLNQIPQHIRDAVLNEMLSRVDLEIIRGLCDDELGLV